MTDASHLLLSLYKANLDLWLRIGELLQENRDQWMELLSRELHDGLVETRVEAHQLREAGDWASLAMLPGSTLWRIAEQQFGDVEALTQTATGNQVTFANGFQQALLEWQEATAGAIGGAIGDAATPEHLIDALRDLSAVPLPGAALAAAPVTAAAARPAAKKTPAARKAPAKKSAVRKAPAKKAAARKVPAKKAAARKAPPKKAAARKATAKKKPVGKAAKAAGSSRADKARKTGKKTGRKVAKKRAAR